MSLHEAAWNRVRMGWCEMLCLGEDKRWACLLTQLTSITVFYLPLRKTKVPFSIFVCSKQMDVCCFHFLFAEDKRKLPFSISSIFHWWNSGNVETWRHGNTGTWWQGDMKTGRQGDIEIWRHGDIKQKMKVQAILPHPFTLCASCKQKFVVCPFVDKETQRKLSICKQTQWT